MRELAALKEDFDANGFLHIRGFMDRAEVDSLAAEFDRFVAEIAPRLPRTQVMYEDYDDPSTLKQIMKMDREDSVFDKLLNDPRLIQLASALLNDEVVPQQVEAFIKAPFKGTPTPAHQDGYYFCLVPNEALTFWLPIGDINADNGALCYIKGSHKDGILPHNASGVLGFSQGLSSHHYEPGEEVICAVEKGDCLLHHSRTIHYASGNSSERPRRSLGLIYFASKARQDPTLKATYDESRNSQQAKLGV